MLADQQLTLTLEKNNLNLTKLTLTLTEEDIRLCQMLTMQ